jgi:hypothetical protein
MRYYYLLVSFLFFQIGFAQQDIFDVARKGTVEEVKAIMKQNPEAINSVNGEGFSPLILACYRGNVAVADFLIHNVKDINGSSSMGTPLMAAVVKKNIGIVKLLLDSKANPNISDASGTTALMFATIFKNYEIVEMLLDASAIQDLKDIRGKSAIDYASISNDEKLIQIFKEHKL